MIRSALIAATGQVGLGQLVPDHSSVVAKGVATFRYAREFQDIFTAAEHKVVVADHDFGPPDYWNSVHDWLSRVRLYDRYVVMLSTAIAILPTGVIEALKPPKLDVFEVVEVLPKYELQWSSADDDAWSALVAAGGDFSSLEFDLTTDQPVEAFDTYWHATQNGWIPGVGPLRIVP